MVSGTVADTLKSLPHSPGVYRMRGGGGEILYVGKARDLKRRVSSYFQRNQENPRLARLVSLIKSVDVTLTGSEIEALLLENNLIKSHHPPFNVLFRDDKSYPYLRISRHEFPALGLYRGTLDDQADYFGPYPNAWAARQTLSHLQKLFRLRNCEESVFQHRTRACLLYQIHRCSGPCVGHVSQPVYQQDVAQAMGFLNGQETRILEDLRRTMDQAAQDWRYEEAAQWRDRIALIQQVLARQSVATGPTRDADIIAVVIEDGAVAVNWAMIRQGRHLGDRTFHPDNVQGLDGQTIGQAFVAQHYAQNPVPARLVANFQPTDPSLLAWLREQGGAGFRWSSAPRGVHREWLEGALQNARYGLLRHQAESTQRHQRLAAVQEALGLATVPNRIECFDISHTQGESPVGACVVFIEAEPSKGHYRRYNITGIEPGDDYAALSQAVQRRYRDQDDENRPDLLLIDGGVGQVRAVGAVLAELGLSSLPVVGIAKGPSRKPGAEVLIPASAAPLHLAPHHPGFLLIQAVRDEAHRFALGGHRAARGKTRRQSLLDQINGIGPQRRRLLLRQFGGLRGLTAASTADIAAVPGIGPALAEKIYQHLH